MTVAIAQAVLSLLAGWLIFRLWRGVASANRMVFWLVTIGTLARAVGGQLAFWISWLHLPVARSLQIGGGFWVFGLDGTMYYQRAVEAASGGARAIIWVDKTLPSPFFIQTLGVAVLLFGAVTSVAVLLNVLAYLATCRVILSLADPKDNRAVTFAIAVVSLAPSVIIWSMQPLKDVWFLFLIVAFFGTARMWQRVWEEPSRPWPVVRVAGWSVAMAMALYGLSGIRWYFSFIILGAAIPFLALIVIRTQRHVAAAVSAFVLFFLLLAAFVAGATAYLPEPFRRAVFHGEIAQTLHLPKTLFSAIDDSRRSFDHAGGATLIGAGGAIRKLDDQLGLKERRVPAVTRVPHAPRAVVRATPAPVPVPKTTPPPAPKTTPPPATPAATASSPAVTHPAPVVVTQNPPAAPVAPPATPPATPKTILPVVSTARAAPHGGEPGEGADNSVTVAIPSSKIGRFLAGTAAVVLPQWVAQRVGLIDVHGGRGLWLLVEVDTLVFDVVLIFAIVSVIRAMRRRTAHSPDFWMLLIVTLTIGGALAYTVSNFGTLFRHRDMFLIGLALLPLVAAESGKSEEPPILPQPETSPAQA